MGTSYFALRVLLVLVVQCCWVLNSASGLLSPTSSPSLTYYNEDVARYSYICLENSQDLCLGISPGSGLPYYNPKLPPFAVQLKQRLRNEAEALDYKKTRWDVRFDDHLVSLSRFSELCISLEGLDTTHNSLALYPCSDVINGTRLGKWDMLFNKNIDQNSTMRLEENNGLCITAMSCEKKKDSQTGAEICSPDSESVVTDSKMFVSGTYVKTKPCWDTPEGDPLWAVAQSFVQAIDCAVGCSPMLQNNHVCDAACANAACDMDNEHCKSAAPTSPTRGPTASPTLIPSHVPSSSPRTTVPTRSPVHRPTHLPTTVSPTTSSPSKSPTDPKPVSARPTTLPSSSPTTTHPSAQPSSHVTHFPSVSPSEAPTSSRPRFSPTHKPTNKTEVLRAPAEITPPPSNVTLIVALTLSILFFCLFFLLLLLVVRERRRKKQQSSKSWSSMIDVNQAAFVEHHQNKKESFCAKMALCCNCRSRKSESTELQPSDLSNIGGDSIIVVDPDWVPSKPNKGKPKRSKLIGRGGS